MRGNDGDGAAEDHASRFCPIIDQSFCVVFITTTVITGIWKEPMGLFDALDRYGRKAEELAVGVRDHMKFSPSIREAAVARLAQGTKLLIKGGPETVFRQAFDVLPGEKFLDEYVCYISTTFGPVIGTIYISNKRMAFCSDFPLRSCSPEGLPLLKYYKVVLPLDETQSICPSANKLKPSERYIHVLMQDGKEFWLMGFVSYNKAFMSLLEASRQAPRKCPTQAQPVAGTVSQTY